MISKRLAVGLGLLVVAGVAYGFSRFRPQQLTLTGIVTTNDVIVSPQVGRADRPAAGQRGRRGHEGPARSPSSPRTSSRPTRAYYAHSAAGLASQVRESEAALRFQERADDRPDHAGRKRRSPRPQAQQAAAVADARERAPRPSSARRTWPQQGVASRAGARSGAHRRTTRRKAEARRAQEAGRGAARGGRARALQRRAGARCAAARCRPTSSSRRRPRRSTTKADVRLAYTEIHAPIDGIVDVRAVRAGRGRERPASRSSR